MNDTNRRPGRPRKRGSGRKKPIVSGQLEFAEMQAVEALQNARARNQSYLVRLAIVRLLADAHAGRIDWAEPIPDTFAKVNEHGNHTVAGSP